ncbi:sugar ABC transporter permease, partial [Klebsiella pneumoniae]
AAFAWSYLLDPQVGLLNYWLRAVGIQLGNVLQDPNLAMPAVVLVAVWKSFGFYMVIFLAGLQDIPTSLYEAARVDG